MVVLPLLILASLAPEARADWSLSAGSDHFAWNERTAPIRVQESGPLYNLEFGVRQRRAAPLGLGYVARLYAGEVDYLGASLAAPDVEVRATTTYLGLEQEGLVHARVSDAAEAVGGLGYDVWRRDLGGRNQREDYHVVALRLGGDVGAPRASWHVGAGFQWTVAAHEDAHFDRLGFDQNPALTLGGSATPYLRFDYLLGRHWSVAGSIDGYAFGRSNVVTLTHPGDEPSASYQPASHMQRIGARITYGR